MKFNELILKKFILFFIFILLISCSDKSSKTLYIFSCVAVKPPLEKILKIYENKNNIKINVTFGGSGTLYNQIKITHKGDIYIPAAPDYIEKGINSKIFDSDFIKLIPLNLGIVTSKKSKIKNFNDILLKNNIRIALVNPETGAIGKYTHKFLEANNLTIIEQRAICFTTDLSPLINLLLLQKVDAVFAWKVCANWYPDKLSFIPIPEHFKNKNSYIPLALISFSKNKKEAKKLIKFLNSEISKNIFKKYGYNL